MRAGAGHAVGADRQVRPGQLPVQKRALVRGGVWRGVRGGGSGKRVKKFGWGIPVSK